MTNLPPPPSPSSLPPPPVPPDGYLPVQRLMVSSRQLLRWTAAVFFAGLIGSNLTAIILVFAGVDLIDSVSPIPFSIVFIGQAAASLWVVYLFSRRAASGSLAADVGLVVKGSDWWALFAGMGIQIAIAFATIPIIQLLFPDGAPSQGVADIASETETTVEILLIFLTVALLAPIVEEILYRGMLLPWLNRFMGRWPAILVSAAVFAGVHLIDWNARAAVPGLFLIGVVLGWAAMRRGDLSLAIPFHAGVNMLAAILLVWGSDLIDWLENQVDELEQVGVVIEGVVALVRSLGV